MFLFSCLKKKEMYVVWQIVKLMTLSYKSFLKVKIRKKYYISFFLDDKIIKGHFFIYNLS